MVKNNMDLNQKDQVLRDELSNLNKNLNELIKLDYTFNHGCFFEENTRTIFINISDLGDLSVDELKWIIHHEFRHSQQVIYRISMFIPLILSPMIFMLINHLFNLENFAVIPTIILVSHMINFIKRRAELDADGFANANLGRVMIPFFKKLKKQREVSASYLLHTVLFGLSHPTYNRRIKG